VNFRNSECLITNEKGKILMRGVKTKENCYLWVSQRKSQTSEQTGMLNTTLEHRITPQKLDLLHIGSVNSGKSISNSWSCKNSSQYSWLCEKQSSDIVDRDLEFKQCDELRGKFGIYLHKKMEQLKRSSRVVRHSLLHTNLGFLSLTHLKLPTTCNNSSPIIAFSFASSKFKNIHLFASHSSQPSYSFIFSNHHQHHQTIMSSKTSSPALKRTMDSELQETSVSVPKIIKPIAAVPPSKSKGKTPTKSGSKKKKPAKSKRELLKLP